MTLPFGCSTKLVAEVKSAPREMGLVPRRYWPALGPDVACAMKTVLQDVGRIVAVMVLSVVSIVVCCVTVLVTVCEMICVMVDVTETVGVVC